VIIDDVRTLLAYHYWARDRMLKALMPLTREEYTKEMGSSFTSIQDTLGHVYSAEWAWHQRWSGVSPTSQLPREAFPDVATVRDLWARTESDVRGFLEGLGEEGLERRFEYKTLAGDPGSVLGAPAPQGMPHSRERTAHTRIPSSSRTRHDPSRSMTASTRPRARCSAPGRRGRCHPGGASSSSGPAG